MKSFRHFALWLLLALVVLHVPASAQVAKGKFPVMVRGVPGQQNTLKVDTSTTPQRTEAGCEKDQEGGTTVHGLRLTGNIAGSNPTILAVGCATGADANIGGTLDVTGTGTWVINGNVTTGVQAVGPGNGCVADTAAVNSPPIRAAANDWNFTQGASLTVNYHCVFTLPWRTTASKGIRIDSFNISQSIAGAALTSNSAPTLSTTTYANAVANAVAAYGGVVTGTQPTAIQATPYLTAFTLGTAAFMGTSNALVSVDWTVVTAVAGTYKLNAVTITYTLALY